MNETLLRAMPKAQQSRAADAIFRARTFLPVDRRLYQAEPGAFGLSVAVAHEAGMRISASVLQRGMAMSVVEPASDSYTFGFRRHGSLNVAGCGRAHDGSWGAGFGVMYRERPGACISTSDRHAGVSFELPYQRIVHLLEGLIEKPVYAEISFVPAFSLTAEPSAGIARVVTFIEQELALPESLFSQGRSGTLMQDFLIRALLTAVPHSYSGPLEREPKAAAPFNVSRAEAFMRANAQQPIEIEQIAAAAGCSIRSLQMAFRKFRGRTPMMVLRRLRLERVHLALQQDTDTPLADIAVACGFTNPGRFATQYQAMYGELPSETRRQARAAYRLKGG